MDISTFDYDRLAPNIRETVKLLHILGYETTDSGDGVANVAAGIEGAMDVPMVAIRTTPEKMVNEARALWLVVMALSRSTDVQVEASYSARDGIALLVLTNFDDRYVR